MTRFSPRTRLAEDRGRAEEMTRKEPHVMGNTITDNMKSRTKLRGIASADAGGIGIDIRARLTR